jgi:hypothetical protein
MEFPKLVPFWGNDHLRSSMLLHVRKKSTNESEQVVLTSAMRIQRTNPYVTPQGLRAIDVAIQSWRAKGFSRLMGKSIEYRLATGVPQPKSHVLATTAQSDFPATMTFRAIFDVFLDDVAVVRGLEGSASSTQMMSIPPRGNDTFQVNKTFEADDYEMKAIACAASESSLTPIQKRLLVLGRSLGLVSSDTVSNLRRDHDM